MTNRPVSQSAKVDYSDVLKTWRSTLAYINTASEEDVMGALHHERTHKRRPLFLNRIYGRFAKLRCDRETKEYLHGEA